MNETIKLINQRVSLRKFSDKLVTKEHFDIIVNSALRAPTAGNLMLYSMIVVKNKERLEKLSVSCDNQPFIKNASFAIIFVADYQRLYDYFMLSNIKDYAKKFNTKIVNPDLSDLLLASEDAIIAAQNSAIAAESLGIGTCYIGDIIENYEFHREFFNLPNYVFPISMLVYGYYPEKINRTPRNRYDKEFIVFEEKYQRLAPESIKKMHKKNEINFNKDNILKADNLGQLIYGKKFSSEFANEMRRSVNVALEYWKKDYE